MDKPIAEWKQRLSGMCPDQLHKTWSARARDDVSWVAECNFHAAVAERMKQMGNMAIDLDDETRLNLCRQANDILERLQDHLKGEPCKLQEIRDAMSEADAYFAKFGSRSARYYMYERGIMTELGDRKPA